MSNPHLVARHRPWAAPARPLGPGLTTRHLVRGGAPWIPVSGEIHYSRVPRARWAERLRQMRSGGLTTVSTYVFWLHHMEREGVSRFDDNLDVAHFADLCAANGLDLILRIGPWCHGETRNGGFPDWVQAAPVRHRTDDPAYLDLVSDWFARLGTALDGRTFAGVQLENELYDQPGHIVTLKRLAISAGISAPLWVATAWGGADLPINEVMPLYGGYGDGFWVDADAPWDPSFRDHYFFSHVWDDPGIGADLRSTAAAAPAVAHHYPPATCELGGGMATAYHRRPRPAPLDVAAPALCKIGNGSAWQGYYMYAGGTNPRGRLGMQESHATGYPNDLPRLGYDFHAAIGEAGVLGGAHAELRQQHAFLAAFGPALAGMPSTLPERMPSGVEDVSTLRWAVRSDGESGFLFIAWHQPHVPLPVYRDAQFRVGLDGGEVVLPSRPADIPAGTLARWPLGLQVGGVRIDYATGSALTVLPGDVPTLVLTAAPGIDVVMSVFGEERPLAPGVTRLSSADVLVLTAAEAAHSWVCGDRLLLSADDLSWGADGRVIASGRAPAVRAYDPATRQFTDLPLDGPSSPAPAEVVTPELLRPAAAVPVGYGKHDGRPSAPSPETFDELAAVYALAIPAWAAETDAILRIDWAGDTAEVRVNGRAATDRFWDGSRWLVNLRDIGHRPGTELTLHVLPLATGSTAGLPADARARLLAADGQLLAVDAVRVTGRHTRTELSSHSPVPGPGPG